jgi:hypothetical protein
MVMISPLHNNSGIVSRNVLEHWRVEVLNLWFPPAATR